MQKALIPKDEKERLASLYKLGLLDTPREARFDVITKIATKIFHVPISTLTLVDAKREWFKSCQGLSQREGDRAISFCGHALLSDTMTVVPDTKKDERFADNPMVTGSPHIRFYAGVPIVSADMKRIGVFCIKDIKPREFSKEDEEMLKGLASWAEVEINAYNLALSLNQGKKLQDGISEQTQKSKNLSKVHDKTNKALLNLMEDLENTRAQLELEKVKDDAMLESIGDGIIAIDNRKKIVMINKATGDMLGWRMHELVGKEITTLPLEDEKGNLLPLSKRPTTIVLSEGKLTKNIYYFVRKDKTRFPIAINAAPIRLKGKIVGLIETIRDVTREREIDAAKSEFVSLASHQLRTPLGIMKWYLEALQKEQYIKKAPKAIQEYFAVICKSNERVLALVRELLSVSRIDQDRIKNAPKSTDVIKIINEVASEMRIIALRKKIKLKVELNDSKLPSIFIDPLRFHEVVENLVANAVAYTPASGKVTVILNTDVHMLFITVKDTGIGMSPGEQEQLFTKFFRAGNAVALNAEGSGLGLYVVKSYVEGWGGKISIVSREGKGSLFTISIPMLKKEIQHNTTREIPKEGGVTATI